jgi:2-keto-3-deoxy-L-rhamnonate aldolase RhmA
VDFVYADLEHNPLDFPALNMFLLGMTDKATVIQKGNLQPNVALFARFPPEADQSQWVVKQALDIGLHGVIFNGVDTPEQASSRQHALPADERIAAHGAGRHSRLWDVRGDLGLGPARR